MFFEPPPPPRERPRAVAQPPWTAAPKEIGWNVPTRLVMARSTKAVIVAGAMVGYSTGFEVTLSLFAAQPIDTYPGIPVDLRFGVAYADGRKGTADHGPHRGDAMRRYYEAVRAGEEPEPPDGVSVTQKGGGGGGGRYEMRYFVWPLPSIGTMRLACQCERFEILETVVEVDAAPFLYAATRSRPVWEDATNAGVGG